VSNTISGVIAITSVCTIRNLDFKTSMGYMEIQPMHPATAADIILIYLKCVLDAYDDQNLPTILTDKSFLLL
jgi:hypothetical protein